MAQYTMIAHTADEKKEQLILESTTVPHELPTCFLCCIALRCRRYDRVNDFSSIDPSDLVKHLSSALVLPDRSSMIVMRAF